MTKRGTMVDDRGRTHDQPPGRLSKVGSRDVREQYRLITQELDELACVRVMVWDMVRVGLASSVFAAVGYTLFVAGLRFQSAVFFAITGVLILFTVLRPVMRRRQIRRLRRAKEIWGERVAAHCHCFLCAYSLDGLMPEADGCTVCPECGGAWKIGCSEDTKANREH